MSSPDFQALVMLQGISLPSIRRCSIISTPQTCNIIALFTEPENQSPNLWVRYSDPARMSAYRHPIMAWRHSRDVPLTNTDVSSTFGSTPTSSIPRCVTKPHKLPGASGTAIARLRGHAETGMRLSKKSCKSLMHITRSLDPALHLSVEISIPSSVSTKYI